MFYNEITVMVCHAKILFTVITLVADNLCELINKYLTLPLVCK